MPAEVVFKAANIAHRGLPWVSCGKWGSVVGSMSSAHLTTVGRKSGRAHTVMLTAPAVDGDRVVVLASRGGDPSHPAWYLNLRDHPEVDVTVGNGPRRSMIARTATAEERAELWPKVIATYDGYAAYQRRTTREIPLVVLTPNPPPRP